MKSIHDVSKFYDLHSIKFLTDYLFGNSRVGVQRRFFSQAIPPNAKKIALIGSGSGEGCWDVVTRIAPKAHLTALDISPRCIELGKLLFSHPRIVYKLADLVEESTGQGFDTILLPDVYEHIPKATREQFHANIKRMLAKRGRILITAPTPSHQSNLRQAGAGLQIVDEDVHLQDLLGFAADIGGTLTFYAMVSVSGCCNCYFHAAIEEGPAVTRDETWNDKIEIRKSPPERIIPDFITYNLDRLRKLWVSWRIFSKLGYAGLKRVWSMKGKRPVVM